MARYARTNLANKGFKDNTPNGWVDTNGPVWWYGSDNSRAYLDGYPPLARSAISRCVMVIASRLSSSTWTLDSKDDSWINDPMHLRPDARGGVTLETSPSKFHQRINKSVFWGAWIRSALCWGMGYLVFERTGNNPNGKPVAGTLELLPPQVVDFEPWSGNYREISYPDGQRAVVEVDSGSFIDPVSRTRKWLWELRNPTTPLDPVTGTTQGTLQWHAPEFALMDDQLFYASGMYGGAGVPSGYLKVNTPNFTQEQADALKEAWQASHGTNRGTAILNASTEYQAIGISPVDTALAEMKRLVWQDIANAFGVPGYLIGAPGGGSMTYSNIGMELQAFYEFTLRPWAVAVEETLSALLPGDRGVHIQPSGEVSGAGAAERGAALPSADVQTG